MKAVSAYMHNLQLYSVSKVKIQQGTIAHVFDVIFMKKPMGDFLPTLFAAIAVRHRSKVSE